MSGYQRQSEAAIQPDEPVTASAFNDEFDALATAFNSSGGHDHSGAIGQGARIDYNDLLNKPTIVTLTSSAPANLAASASVGVATTAARADHVHARPSAADIGAATSGHTHSNATTSVAGFMSASDKSKLDGITSGAAPGTVTLVQGSTGITTSPGGGISTTGTVAIDSTVVATKTATNNFANNLQQNMIIIGEGFPVVAKGSVSGSVSCDLSTGSFFTMTVGATSATVTFTNAKSGRAHVVYLLVTFTSGAATFAITGDKMRGSPAPLTPTSTSANSQAWSTSGVDVLQCITFDGGTNWYVTRLMTNPT